MPKMIKPSKFIILSPLSKEECYSRIKESIDTSFFSVFGSKPLAGKISENSAQIRKRINYQNSFQTQLTAKFIASPKGTKIEGYFGIHKLVKFLIASIICFLVLTEIAISRLSSIGGIALIVSCCCVIFIGKYIARDEASFIKDYLIDLLETNEKSIEQEGGADG